VKDYIQQLISTNPDPHLARCIVREYLQARVLECLQEQGAFADWAFVGGTALRFLYSMPRFSEDLDFSLARAGIDAAFADRMRKIQTVFAREGYRHSIKAKTDKTVQSAFVKFEGLLSEFGLSPHRSETLSIKVDIDTNPPAGAKLETSLVRRHCLLNLCHYDRGSLLAGKVHALLNRAYIKGRDLYDLMWYLSDRNWPAINLPLLNQALSQTAWTGPEMTADNWKPTLALILSGYDWDKVIADVRPFLEKQTDLDLLTKDNLLGLLQTRP
jgi:hypothetical protein